MKKDRSHQNHRLHFMHKKEDKTPIAVKVSLSAFAIVLALSLWAFLHGRVVFKFDGYVLATDVAGQFGDFIGGAIGTIVSVCLLYYTFSLQREATSQSSQTARLQQFHDTFYRFVDHYLKITDGLYYTEGNAKFRGKQVLSAKYKKMQTDFVCGKNDENDIWKQAMDPYMSLYANDGLNLATLYRTLYSAFREAHRQKADIGEQASITAIKFLRSQMNDAELCLLRYNSKSMQGRPFLELINEYNLLKHLPPLELLEYTYWRNKLNADEQSATNIILQASKKNIYKVLEKKESDVESDTNNASVYNVNVSVNKERTQLTVCLYINPQKVPDQYDLVKGFHKLNHVDRASLLMFFLRDTIILSFAPDYVNHPRDLEWGKDTRKTEGKYFVWVKNIKSMPLRMRNALGKADKA